MKFLNILTVVVALFCVACGTTKVVAPQPKVINLALVTEAQANRFVELDYGIRLNVQDGRTSERLLKKHDNYVTSLPTVGVNPEVLDFVNESTRRYMRTMGFNLDSDVATDYMLNITVKEFNLSFLSGIGWSGHVQLNIEVYDHNRKLVYPSTVCVGRANIAGSGSDYVAANTTINKAYAAALKDIDWDRIAFFLKKASSPKLEKNKQVTGEGNTALESTVINWMIDSSPRGADISWRVLSSTPQVQNTNSRYLGATPYESTETFDIKGLTYNNSGNVQIVITVEKAGYMSQTRRFNLRQAIDQKEISLKLNLVKEE